MSRDELRDAIERPAGLANVALTPQLVERVLNDAGDDPARLPVLQHALMRTFDKGKPGPLTVEHYEQIGGMAHALDWHAKEIFQKLPPEDRAAARRMFQRLSERRAGARDTRRPAAAKDIADVAGVSLDRVQRLYEYFSGGDRTFLTSRTKGSRTGRVAKKDRRPETLAEDTLIDVTHESLLNGWNDLNDWITDEEEWGRRFLTYAGGIK
jgi:hypothetical protein